MRPLSCSALFAIVFLAGTHAQTVRPAECENLAAARLPNTRIAVAERVVSGSFTPPGSSTALTNLPAFCRVAGEITPTAQSHILFEVWMPLQNWNGKFAGVGNGGWAGTIGFNALAQQLRRGHATASTNTGHEAVPGLDMAKFAAEYPERLTDFAHRSHHETALKAKAIIQTFYGRPSERSYFIGCSSGGYEGLMEVQRYPADYDGIVAGAPANNWTRLMAADFDAVLAMLKEPASQLSRSALQVVAQGAVAACDKLDGVVDGLIDDPRQCTFDPSALTCQHAEASDLCLTPAQVAAVKRVYAGLTDPKSGALLYPGLERGSEATWPNVNPATPFGIPVSHYKWLVMSDGNWDWRTFDFSSPAAYEAFQRAESRLAPLMNATEPNLRAFRQRGGKLLQYHGWNDNLIAPRNSIDYYESVARFFAPGSSPPTTSDDVQSFFRLYMVPGMGHCGGGPGPNTFDLQVELENWVERGVAPGRVIATHSTNGSVDRSRPLCAYPQVAIYKGEGSIDIATSFECRAR